MKKTLKIVISVLLIAILLIGYRLFIAIIFYGIQKPKSERIG